METSRITDSRAQAPAGGTFGDYNLKAVIYWWVVCVLGAIAILLSVAAVIDLPRDVQGIVAVGIALAGLAGAFPVRLPNVHAIFENRARQANDLRRGPKRGGRIEFGVGDFYTFLLLFAYGVPGATLAAAAEALIMMWRTSRRLSSWIMSPAIAAMTLYAFGSMFLHGAPALGLRVGESAGTTVFAALLFAVPFFIVNSMLMMGVALLRGKLRPSLSAFVGSFGPLTVWVMFNAGFAALLVFAFRDDLVKVMLYSAVPFALAELFLQRFARQQDADRVASERQQARIQSLFNDAAVGMAMMTADGRMEEASAAFTALFGYDADRLCGRFFVEFVDAEDVDTWNRALRRTHGDFAKFSLELRCRHASGRVLWLTLHVSASSEITGSPGLILQAEDSTARMQTARELDHLAHHDSLTGLANRRRFIQLLSEAVVAAQASPAKGYAVLFLDFDGFKRINDTLGHPAGDRFLAEMAYRMRNSVRPMDVVARLGGDEFAILLPLKIPEEEGEARAIADRILQALAHPHPEQGEVLQGRASIGIVTSRRGYAAEAEVMREADTAMYAAKSSGTGRVVTLG
jgi:diguanylate cyclase (GGDEF)-like protein/PAS domain S-box-containing protein